MSDDNMTLMDVMVSFMDKYSKREMDTSTLISLLTLSNVLGILTYLRETEKGIIQQPGNIQQLAKNLNLKDLDMNNLSSTLGSLMGNQGSDKINPMAILNLAKMLGSQMQPPPSSEKKEAKASDKDKKKQPK